jgi:hypothetical protein
MIGRLHAALGPDVVTLVVSDNGWGSYPGRRSPHESVPFDGRHEIEGVMIAHGPEIARAELEPLTLYDVAPLILYLTDVPVPERLSGRVPTAAIEPRALAARPIRRATGPVGPTRDGKPIEPPHEESEIERLRSLGYVQ